MRKINPKVWDKDWRIRQLEIARMRLQSINVQPSDQAITKFGAWYAKKFKDSYHVTSISQYEKLQKIEHLLCQVSKGDSQRKIN